MASLLDRSSRLLGLWQRLRPRLMLAALPFALLANSSAVNLTLQIEPNGTAVRRLTLAAAPYFRDQLARWARDVTLGSTRWDCTWMQTGEKELQYARDVRLTNIESIGDEAGLTINDVFQTPLSLYTTYRWRERVRFNYEYETDPLSASAAGKVLRYAVVMPGPVTEANVQPAKGSRNEIEGHTVVFQLDASQGEQTIEVQAQRLRWGYLLVLAYVACYLLYRLVRLVKHQLRLRPRKI